MAKTLEQYIEEDNYLYDLSLESTSDLYKDLDVIERYFIYTAYTTKKCGYEAGSKFIEEVKEKYQGIIDCDGSSNIWKVTTLTYDIYKTLWNLDITPNHCSGTIPGFEGLFGGDIMNSVRTKINALAEKWHKEDKIITDAPHGNYSKNYLTDQYVKNKDKILKCVKNTPSLEDSLAYYHTLGNLVLVPYYFNGYRGSSKKIQDYFDRSLEFLKANNFKQYNKKYFYKYVNYFFLWDYLEDGKIRSISGDNYFENINSIILKRGEFMFKMLKLAQENKELYDQIREEVFMKSDSCYSSFDEVLEKLESTYKITL